MATELERLEEQLKLAFDGPAWHGPSVREALEGVTAAQASAHPIEGAHSIWEIVLHLAATHALVLRRVRGEARHMTPEQDWPPVAEPTDENWRAAVAALADISTDTCRVVAAFAAEGLDRALVPDPTYSAYMQFIGLTQHDLYHSGQIVLLKRALGTVR